ncbi:hypothetical protein J8281_09500 [Aquimarina sp. U1-2]|uniref:hypothetical protein n=1 Tax=Aquimarina sp. U1-2 TaxID=2823141 RepID=UPI001AECEDE6|nr:hypothetical protein [Aquimarina sp. U1-2]MBP2832418.1 hypothetical protein [Aquimarina sp. U1-2]
MKLGFLCIVSFLCMSSISSFGQDFKNDLTSVKTIDDKIQKEKYNSNEVATADRLVLRTSLENISKKDKAFFSKKEWRKIKRQLSKNKKRFTKVENSIHTYKTVDTIFIDTPIQTTKSRLSSW